MFCENLSTLTTGKVSTYTTHVRIGLGRTVNQFLLTATAHVLSETLWCCRNSLCASECSSCGIVLLLILTGH